MVLEQQQLIPGLPDEIAMECLVRVPYQFHSNMKSVCHTWQDLISHPCFYQERQKSGYAEQLVCLVQPLLTIDSTTEPLANTIKTENQDEKEQQQQQQLQIHRPPQYALSIFNATHNIWQRTRPEEGIPLFSQCLAVPSSGKILLLGGWDPNTLEPVPDVHILEFIGVGSCRWRLGAPMSVARSFFSCAVVGPSTVYVAGGHDSQKNALRSAEVYDVEANQWRTLPDMIEERDECQGMAWEGDSKFWVASGYCTESQGQFRSDAECYDPDTGSWSKVNGVWPFSGTSPRGATTTVSVNNKHHQWWWFLEGKQQQEQGREVDQENDENKKWETIDSIPPPNSTTGTAPCVTTLQVKDQNKQQVFVMCGGGRRSKPASGCDDCDGEAFILERSSTNGTIKWNHIHTPKGFSAFPYSASNLTI